VVKFVLVGTVEQEDPEVYIRFFLFGFFPPTPTALALDRVFFELANYALHALLLERPNVCTMPNHLCGSVGRVGRAVHDLNKPLAARRYDFFRKRPQIEPFEVILA
jgi:hypothetical protein